MDRQPIISAKDVEITFSLRGKKLNAIRKCSLDLYDGETLAIVGESGSGKSVFTKTFVGMLDVNGKITGGSIMYEGRDMTKFTEKDWLGVRGKKIAMVMQDPMTSLNPLKKIGKQIQESIEHHQGLKGAEAKKAAIEMLAKVGIPDPERRYEQYPHEFSGGQRQRVGIARALIMNPKLIIADEVHLGTGRVDPGTGRQPDEGHPAGDRHGLPVHRTRPVHGQVHLRPYRCAPSGPPAGNGYDGRNFCRSHSSLHPEPAVGYPAAEPGGGKNAAWPRLTTMPLPASTTAKAPATSSAAATTSSVPMKSLQSGVNKMKTQVS